MHRPAKPTIFAGFEVHRHAISASVYDRATRACRQHIDAFRYSWMIWLSPF